MKKTILQIFTYCIYCIPPIMFSYGIYCMFTEQYFWGMFHIICNSISFYYQYKTYKKTGKWVN